MQVNLLAPKSDLSVEQEIRIAEVRAEYRIVVLSHRTQQQRLRFFEQKLELRQNPGVPVIQPFGAAGFRADVAAVIEHREGVAVLQRQSTPLLQRRAGGNIELRD
jgi:hypothetical protein